MQPCFSWTALQGILFCGIAVSGCSGAVVWTREIGSSDLHAQVSDYLCVKGSAT